MKKADQSQMRDGLSNSPGEMSDTGNSRQIRILYLGSRGGTCRHRCLALERLGHLPTHIDPVDAIPFRGLAAGWAAKTGAFGLEMPVARFIMARIRNRKFDLTLVDSGSLVGPALLRALRSISPVIINYNPDNPFVSWDRVRWRLMRRALPFYDVFVCPRLVTAQAALSAGARRVLQVDFAADELAHRPLVLKTSDRKRFEADVVFVGSWLPERGGFLLRLVERGVPLKIYGPRWHKAPEYEALKPYIAGGLMEGIDYGKALQAAKISIGLLSAGNEDLHTTRSLEVPAMGVLLCAQRTSQHVAMYEDGVEAVFWDDADECADRCLNLLNDPERIQAIAASGRMRVLANNAFNEPLMAKIVAEAMAVQITTG